jgi:hypothetical protein
MDDNDLLTRVRREIEADLGPVTPLRAPGLRALWLPATWLVLATLVLSTFGLRGDVGALGAWGSAGFSLIEVTCGLLLFLVALRLSIPAMAGSLSTIPIWMAGALLVHFLVSWATLGRSALAPPPGHQWSAGLACLSAITLLSLAPLAVGTILLRRGLLTQALPAFLLTGLASGLAAEAVWRLHCAYSTWGHVLPFHSAALILPLLVATAAATSIGRRA